MNRVGTLLYNICLFLTIGILFLALKHFNLEDPNATMDYSYNLKTLLLGFIWAYYAFGVALSIAALISKARKKKIVFTVLIIWFWVLMGINALFIFIPDVLQDQYTTSGWRYSIMMITIVMAFVPALGLIFHQFPGTVDRNYLIKQIKDKVVKEQTKAKSYCPECKFPSEKEWKHCPKCGAHFSD
jgi:Kef-type K+ transport system membrane component KefB